jgi:hypothetical protein
MAAADGGGSTGSGCEGALHDGGEWEKRANFTMDRETVLELE